MKMDQEKEKDREKLYKQTILSKQNSEKEKEREDQEKVEK